MNSAFGIDHGEVSKSFNKLNPKLLAAKKNLYARMGSHNTMDERIKTNYAVWRGHLGAMGKTDPIPQSPSMLAQNKTGKDHVNAMLTASANRNKRRRRVLP